MSTRTRRKLLLALLVAAAVLAQPGPARAGKLKHLLVVTYTTGYRHSDSIAVAEPIIAQIGERSRLFDVDYARTAEDLQSKMTREALRRYDAVFLCQTTGDLGLPDRQAFLDYIRAGHGFIGTHSATDTYHNWPEYLQMIGGEFKTHGAQVEVDVHVEDPSFPAVRALPPDHRNGFKVFDEIYEFENFSRDRAHVILSMNVHPQTHKPGDYWTSWCRCEGKGRVFYMALGHRPEVWQQQWYQDYLLGGIRWALHRAKGSCAPSSAVTTTKP